MRSIRIQREDFDPAVESDSLTAGRHDIGAIVTFTGHVRADDGLRSLTLEHYPGMTEREVERHLREAERRWPLLNAAIIHRIGRLLPGERIVFVAAAAAHRAAAFQATEFLIDYLKTRAPFWKQEQRGETTSWVEPRQADETALSRWR
jgi:molybdopterin synthase catalytic subunit